jgi:hypothetical protein
MRRRLCLGVLGLALTLGFPAVAAAAPAAGSADNNLSGGIFVPPSQPTPSWTVAPTIVSAADPHSVQRFTSTATQALKAAEHTPQMQALHRRQHPLQFYVHVWTGNGVHWEVFFDHHGKTVAEVDVSPAGRATAVWTGPLAVSASARGHYGGLFDSPWVVLVFSALFLVPFVNPRRLRPMTLLDGGLLLGAFALPYFLFDHGHFKSSFFVLYPLLLLVLARMLYVGLRGRRDPDDHRSPLPLPMLAVGLVGLVAARIVLDIVDPNVIDVGVASVTGAHAIVHGQALYGSGAGHGDTYGPIAYLAYVPFEALFPWKGVWDSVPAAHAAAIFFDLCTTVGLLVLGCRLRAGRAGRRLGLTLAWAWAACPISLFTLMFNGNDGLIAMLFVIALLVYASPVGRGATLGLAAAAKLFPVVLLPLFAAGWRSRNWRASAVTVGIFALVIVAALGAFLPPGGVHEVYDRTIGFQLGRDDVYSLWALYPGLDWLKLVVEAAVCLFAAGLFFLPPRRTIAQVAALAAAVTVAVQLPALHVFYFYLDWVLPFALVALFAAERDPAAADAPATRLRGHAEDAAAAVPIPAPAG